MNFQYTVTNPGAHFPHRFPGPVVIRTHSREVVKGWTDYAIRPRCLDRARYGLEAMERRAGQVLQHSMPWGREVYS